MSAVLGVVVLDADSSVGAIECRLAGVSLRERSVRLLTVALPGALMITSGIDRELGELVDAADVEMVVLHDACYPFVTAQDVQRVRAAVDPSCGTDVAAIGVVEVTDTLKQVDETGIVTATVDRTTRQACVGLLAVTPAVLGAVLSTTHWGPTFAADATRHQAGPAGAAPRSGAGFAALVTRLERLVGVRAVELRTVDAQEARRVASGAVRVSDEASCAYAEAVLASRFEATATSSA